MRVMFFHAYPHQYAGAQRIVELLAGALPERGVETWVTLPDEGPFADRLRTRSIDVRVVPSPELWRRYGRALESPMAVPALGVLPYYWLRLARAIRRWRPDIVHCNDHRGVLLCGPAARALGLPLVWHLHGPYGLWPLTHAGSAMADRILVVSGPTAREMPALRRHARKVRIFPNGIPPVTVAAGGDVSAIRRDGRRAVLTGARIHPDKGLDVLLHAAKTVTGHHPDVDFYVAGHVQKGYESHHRDLLALRRSLDLDERFHFLGAVSNPGATWAAADVYVQPSRAEPFGLGVLEAMSLSKPVIVSATGGLAEIVEDGRSGVQVPPEDPSALAEGLSRLLEDAGLAERLGRGGLSRMRSTYSEDSMLDRLLAEYGELGVRAT